MRHKQWDLFSERATMLGGILNLITKTIVLRHQLFGNK
jgi:hypothetical protein